MSELQPEAPKKQTHPEHRIIIRGNIVSKKPLLNIRVLDTQSGQVADVDIQVSYALRNLTRGDDVEEKSYTLLVCINDEAPYECILTIPGIQTRSDRNFDLDLDQWPRKPQTHNNQMLTPEEEDTVESPPPKAPRTRKSRAKPTKKP